MGIPTYLVIDAITTTGKLRRRIELQLWQRINGEMHKIEPDEDNGFVLPAVGLRILSESQRIRFIDLATGAEMLDSSELRAALESERQQRLAEYNARQAEHAARLQAEAEIARLRAELRQLRGEEEGN